MSTGNPLDDSDRIPWLRRVAEASRDAAVFSPSHVAVLACSALKRKYRGLLSEAVNGEGEEEEGTVIASSSAAAVPSVAIDFVLLRAPREELRARLERRQEKVKRSSGAAEEIAGHFLPPSLLDSQLESWEDSEEVMVVENGGDGGRGSDGSGGNAARTAATEVVRAVGLEALL